jgi:hypothetical protein
VSAARRDAVTLAPHPGTCRRCRLWTPGTPGTQYHARGREALGRCRVYGADWPGWYTACRLWQARAGRPPAASEGGT